MTEPNKMWASLRSAKARPRVAARPFGCESLEGRQLLTGGMHGFDPAAAGPERGMGAVPADVSGDWDRSTANSPDTGGQSRTSATPGDPGRGGGGGGAGGDRGPGAGMMSISGDRGPGDGPEGDRRLGGAGMMSISGDREGGEHGMMGGAQLGGSVGDSTQARADFEKLRTDEQAIHDKSEVTPKMQAQVRADLKAVRAAATGTADATAQATLDADRKAAWSNPGGPTDDQLARVQADEDAVYKSQGASDALIAQLDTDRQAIVTASNVTDADRATLAADRAAIEADMAKGRSDGQATPTVATPATTTSQNSSDVPTTAAATASPTTTPSDPTATAAAAATTPASAPVAIQPQAMTPTVARSFRPHRGHDRATGHGGGIDQAHRAGRGHRA